MLTAWGDESGSQPDRDPDTYLIAAALCDEDDVPDVRKTMESLRLATEKKVRWHGSSADRRHDLVAAVAALPLAGLVVIHTEAAVSDRRHRRKCLEYLLPNLAEMPCSHITLESRGHLDASDVDILQKFRAQKVIASSLRVNHARRHGRAGALGRGDRVRRGGPIPGRESHLPGETLRCGRPATDLTRKRREPQASSPGE
ncbi:hypothetical protein [Rhodococcus jostii]|uniref:hypothetical protein n=1 Tax=Rhodococcus jostii TaxID=132919 RepID=UPI0036494DA4